VSPGCGDVICNAPSPHFQLPDTNQRACYGDSAEITCASSGEDFFGEDAQYGWDTTHESAERFTRHTTVTGFPVVTDNVTGLMWQGCALGYTGDSCSAAGTLTRFIWTDALAECDSLSWSGYTDCVYPMNSNSVPSWISGRIIPR